MTVGSDGRIYTPKGFQSPQWGSNSKADRQIEEEFNERFSPLNGEVILKSRRIVSSIGSIVSVPSMGK